jgi:hypothetical protein
MRAICVSLSLLLAAPVLAQEPAPPPPPPPAPGPAPGVHLHDGFYLRIGTGFGSHFESINRENYDPGVTMTGMASVGELAVGWAVAPGVILGAGTYSSTVIASERSFDTTQPMPPASLMDEATDFNVFGPFVDWYFRPDGGLHAQLSIGLATVRGVGITDARYDDDEVTLGAGVMLGFGYDWWVSDDWSFGILGRVAAAAAVTEDDSGVRWEHGVGASPSLLFTATFN